MQIDDLIQMYRNGLTVRQVSNHFGLGLKRTWKALGKAGVLRPPGKRNRHGTNAYGSGRRLEKHGYIGIYKPDHPNCTKNGYVLEHRLVMEAHIGRYLSKVEVVHHKNGVVTDNSIHNLELFQSNSAHISATMKGKVPSSRIAKAVVAAKKANTGRTRPSHWKSCGTPLQWHDDIMRKWYEKDDLTAQQIAGLLGRSQQSVLRRLKMIGLTLRVGKYRTIVAITESHLREASQLEPMFLGHSQMRALLCSALPCHLKVVCEEVGLYPSKTASMPVK